MGFAGVFAYSIGIQHGWLLAGLTVLMAVALEGIKPLAVASSLAAFRSWAFVRGLLLGLLALVAILFSLTSALSLTSASRGDLSAKRAAVLESHDDRRQAIKAARAELAALAPSRTIEEAKADIAKLLAGAPKAGNCINATANAAARYVCPKVESLKGEQARAKRRSELQATIDKHTNSVAPAAAVKSADPGASSLATYLAALGINVPAGLLSDWLVLVPVVALELGAALALVLVQAVTGSPTAQPSVPVVELNSERPAEGRPGQPGSSYKPVELGQPGNQPDPNKPAKRTRQKPGKRTKRNAKRRLGNVVRLIQVKGGQVVASQKALARQLRLSKTRTHELLKELEGAGRVKLRTSRKGTSVALVA
jgi:hypothetical protein